MTIDELVSMARRVHDAERYDLGAASTREYRNAYWARVVGIAHHGHPSYNLTPDPQWHLKDGGGGRPQSDDVAVSMPSRAFWDCIGGVGANSYTFHASGHAEPLPAEQNVYPPPVPSGTGVVLPPPDSLWSSRHADVLQALRSLDTRIIAEQFAASFPNEAWGQKRADQDRPISDDTIARLHEGRLYGYQVVPGTRAPAQSAGQAIDGWTQYLATWRPGKPHPQTWTEHFTAAWATDWPGTVRT